MSQENSESQNEGRRPSQYMYWWRKWKKERGFSNSHFEYFFTDYFDVPKIFYENKKVLDIGCGPRGSLEWTPENTLAVGLDPLAVDYARFGITNHKALYVNARAEKIPFIAGSFDCVSAFNSLNYVDGVDKSIDEIRRVLKPAGVFLLVVEINSLPTMDATHTLSSSILDRFGFDIVERRTYHKPADKGCYDAILDERNLAPDDGATNMWLIAKMRKRN